MKLPALFRRRRIWLPTLWSGLLALVVCSALAALAIRHLYDFLAPNAPLGTRVLVVEGWMPSGGLDQAIDVFRRGGYERIVTTGGPIEDVFERGAYTGTTYAERARSYLVRRGVPSREVIAVPAPTSAQDRSFLNAVMVRQWASQSLPPVDALDVISSGPHARRSWLLYRMAFGEQASIGILTTRPSAYAPETWWRTSAGAKEVLLEAIAWAWTELFFHPAPARSHDEMWGASPAPQRAEPRQPPASPGARSSTNASTIAPSPGSSTSWSS